jgi:hypothetical protein
MLTKNLSPLAEHINADTMKDIPKLECHPKSLAVFSYLSTLDRLFPEVLQ